MADPRKYAEWLVNNQDKKGTPEFDTVAAAYQRSRSQLTKVETKSAADYPPTEGFMMDAAAGLGKMATGLGRGIQQRTRLGDQKALQETIDESRRLDRPLSQSAGGFTGEVVGNIGMAVAPGAILARAGALANAPRIAEAGKFLLSSPSTLGGATTQAGLGATLGFLQPTATGESVGRNVMVGAAGGSAVPLAGMGLNAVNAGIQPLYSGGRDVIAGRALRRAAGENVDDVIRSLERSRSLIPGSQPTAAEVAGSPGIAALQRAAAAVDPESYGIRVTQQNEARIAALQNMAGTEADRAMAKGVRGMMTELPYEEALSAPIPKAVSDSVRPQIDNLMSRPSMKKAVSRAKEIFGEEQVLVGKEGSVRGLQYTKQALDDIIEKASSPTSSIGKNELRALEQTRSDLIKVIEDVSPKLRQADVAYRDWSRPINQMDVAADLAERSTNKLTGVLQPQSYARNLNDDLAARATGRSRATLQNTMDQGQLSTLENVRQDMARSVAARDMGRGPGSDTVQKLSMTNLMERSGVPLGVLNTPGLGRLGNWAYQNADELIKQRLAQGLLNPQEAAQLMKAAKTNPNIEATLEAIRRISAPSILGGSFLLNAPQQ